MKLNFKNNQQTTKIFTIVLFTIYFLMQDHLVMAQPIPTPIDIPIDGGVFYLLAAGIAYGARKIYRSRNQKDEN